MALTIRLCFWGMFAILALWTSASSQESAEPVRQEPQAVWKNPRHHERTAKAYELLAEDDFTEAEDRLRELLADFDDAFERSQVLLGLANVLILTDRLDEALPLYAEIVQLDRLSNQQHFQAMFQLAQLHAMQENYDDALHWIERWLTESGEERADAYVLKASIHAESDAYAHALASIDRAIALSQDVHESWLQLKLACHVELDQYLEARDVLFSLVRGWPKKKIYWTQLASTLVALKSESQALAVLALAHRQGLLDTEQDYMQLFNLYGYLDLPYQAATVLQAAIESGRVTADLATWEKLGNAWYAAREQEQSIGALARAAELSESGMLDMQVAMILIDAERYPEASPHLRRALEKGGITDSETGNLHILLGMTELNNDQSESARHSFRKALEYESSEVSARQWLNHMMQASVRR